MNAVTKFRPKVFAKYKRALSIDLNSFRCNPLSAYLMIDFSLKNDTLSTTYKVSNRACTRSLFIPFYNITIDVERGVLITNFDSEFVDLFDLKLYLQYSNMSYDQFLIDLESSIFANPKEPPKLTSFNGSKLAHLVGYSTTRTELDDINKYLVQLDNLLSSMRTCFGTFGNYILDLALYHFSFNKTLYGEDSRGLTVRSIIRNKGLIEFSYLTITSDLIKNNLADKISPSKDVQAYVKDNLTLKPLSPFSLLSFSEVVSNINSKVFKVYEDDSDT